MMLDKLVAECAIGRNVTLKLQKRVNGEKMAFKKRFLKVVKFLAAVKIGA
jgi:hypothetical protein